MKRSDLIYTIIPIEIKPCTYNTIFSVFFFTPLATLAVFSGLSTTVHADDPPTVVIGDTFAVKAGSRDAGKPLNLEATEIGGVTWGASSSIILTPDGTVTSDGTDGAAALTPLTGVKKAVTVSAQIDPTGSGWVGLCLLSSEDPDSFWDTLQILVTIRPSGDYELFANGVKINLSQGTVNLKPGMNSLALTFNPEDNTVSLKINDIDIVSKSTLGDFKPVISAVGFRFHESVTPKTPQVGNFTVSGNK